MAIVTDDLNARCETDPELFFDGDRIAEAIAFCGGCPLKRREACRGYARKMRIPYGVFGGETATARLGRMLADDLDGPGWAQFKLTAREEGFNKAADAAAETGLPEGLLAEKADLATGKYTPRTLSTGSTERSRKLLEERTPIVMQMAADGISRREICRKMGFSKDQVIAILGRDETVPKVYMDEVRAEIVRLAASGSTHREIAAQLGVSRGGVFRVLKKDRQVA